MFGWLIKLLKASGMVPRISETEQTALEAGTVWLDGEFFSGRPDFSEQGPGSLATPPHCAH